MTRHLLVFLMTCFLFFSCEDNINVSISTTGSIELTFVDGSSPVKHANIRIAKWDPDPYNPDDFQTGNVFEGLTSSLGVVNLGPLAEGRYVIKLYLESNDIFTEYFDIIPNESISKDFDVSNYRSNATFILLNGPFFEDFDITGIDFYLTPTFLDDTDLKTEDRLSISIKGERASNAVMYRGIQTGHYYFYAFFESEFYRIRDPHSVNFVSVKRGFDLEEDAYIPGEIVLLDRVWQTVSTNRIDNSNQVENVIIQVEFEEDKMLIDFGENGSPALRKYTTEINSNGFVEVNLSSQYEINRPFIYRLYDILLLPSGELEMRYYNDDFQYFKSTLTTE